MQRAMENSDLMYTLSEDPIDRDCLDKIYIRAEFYIPLCIEGGMLDATEGADFWCSIRCFIRVTQLTSLAPSIDLHKHL